jgi:hypothetical protein
MMICISYGEFYLPSVHQKFYLMECALKNYLYRALWWRGRYVLYKERNMLLTESNLSRRHGYMMVQPQRRKKVRKSMGAIKHVLGERKRAKIADHKLYLAELERFDGLMADLNLVDGTNKEDELEEALHKESNELKMEKVD